MSFFPGAQNTVIHGGNFISHQWQSFQLHNEWEKERYAMQALEQHVAFGAFHNSHDRYDAPRCLPRTREAVFRELNQWIHITSIWKPILWLYGPAGSGKSAIAQSIAEKAQEMNYLLVGTYFFNKSDGLRNNMMRVIPSLAYQLILALPSTREYVLNKIIQEPGVFSLNLKTQMEKLILHPLLAAGVVRWWSPNTAYCPMVIVIDGLDECQNSDERIAFLQALIDCCQDPQFPLITLCHSRPENDIRAAFNDLQTSELADHLVLDDKFNPDSDIQTFLTHHFGEIKAKHVLRAQIPRNWPSWWVIKQLVMKSSGQFIYASTAMKHITSRRHDPMKRLETVLSVGGGSDTSPFKELDALYRAVLSCVEGDDHSTVSRIVGMICSSVSPPTILPQCAPDYKSLQLKELLRRKAFCLDVTPAIIDQVLNLEAGKTLLLIDELHSLINVHGPDDPLQPFHASLGDFLRDRSRSGTFYVDPGLPPADHLLAYFKSLLNACILSRTADMEIYPPSRGSFSEANLTAELLEFFETFPWEYILSENVPRGSVIKSAHHHYPDRPWTSLIWHICELYNFCKMASKRTLAWAPVYQRALRGLVVWVDTEMTLPSSNDRDRSCRGQVLRHYIAKHLSSDNRPEGLLDMVLDVLLTPGLSCTHHISAKCQDSVTLRAILRGLVLNQFPPALPHAKSLIYAWSHRQIPLLELFEHEPSKNVCPNCRSVITKLIDISNRTSYLDALLPYIETEVCHPDWVCEEFHCSSAKNSVEELKATITRYKKKPIPDYYDYNSEWDADIPSLRAAAAQMRRARGGEPPRLSQVLPFRLTIFE